MIFNSIAIGFFGVFGVLSRFWLSSFFNSKPGEFPTSTFIVNLLGCFLIGILFSISQTRSWINPDLSRALSIGFLGGFTTFSAFSLESLQLLQSGRLNMALLYFLGTPILGLVFAFSGMNLAQKLL